MNLKKLEKASKVLEKIKALDLEIIEIDKFAILVASGKTKINFEIRCEDIRKKEEEKNKIRFDEYGSIRTESHENDSTKYFLHGGFLEGMINPFHKVSAEKKDELIIKNKLSDTATLSILGVLLCEKQNERRKLIESIKEMGFVI